MLRTCRIAVVLPIVALLAMPAFAAEPLHVEIDRLIAAKFAGRQPAPPADDAAFFRRVNLDLAGQIPTAAETRAFAADAAADKRAQAIDHLLAAPTYAGRMDDLFHVMLMERRGEHDEWRKFLRAAFEQNRPWNHVARDILNPLDLPEETRGAAFFYSKRLEKYGENPTDFSGLTRDVGRLFLGVDLQCAECHDHLFIDDYKQVDFQGLHFVYKNLANRGGKFPAVDQKAMTEKLDFVSVFDPTQKQTGPRIPFGKEFDIPELPKADAEKKEPDANAAGYNPLSLLAGDISTAGNELFARNIANRLWFVMIGRGLVTPLDLFHSGNPPSHPELLDLLAREFAAHNFDVKWFLRELALSETYQRSSLLPEGADAAPEAALYLVAHEKRLSAEQLLSSVLRATGNAERLSKSAEGEAGKQYAELEKSFVAAFANEAREPEVDFNASVKGALFLLNDDKVLALLQPQPDNLIGRLAAIDDGRQLTDDLFLSIFSRLPADEERAAVLAYLEKNPDRKSVALGHVAWGMLASIEFCVNH